MKPWIQIAGIRDEAEARMLVEEGVTDLAFPLGTGVAKPDLAVEEAGRIVRALPREVFGVLITYLAEPEAVLALCDRLGVARVQLHGTVSAAQAQALKRLRPGLHVMKSLVVGSDALDTVVEALAPYVDAFLTDTFDPTTGARGATGKTHDWAVSARLVARSPRPVMLAGGLTPENVGDAIRAVHPAGVDAHTGVEGADGRKDRDRVRRFVRAAAADVASNLVG